ncbi:MAG: hypothetical protein E4H41_07060 [Gemmatimonadales bacterium]|jgi:hypothetical protein|nr:MAG: hypothetical protein E4H41_07060 [Gemmatimonadales bacterium]
MRNFHIALVVVGVTVAGCNKQPEPAHMPAAGGGAMMGGTQMPMQGTQLMTTMGGQLDSLATMTPAQMAAVMPAHEALTSQMMGTMDSGMQGMNMQRDSGWMALNDSVRQDLATMPDLSGAALQVRMQAHIGRMRRMMTMYQGMPHN